ncbi:MAG: response regulator, partial [Planctomycetota bacterium]
MSEQHILIAEDNRLQARILIDQLMQLGYRVSHGMDGQAAYELAKQDKPHLIVSDIEMPVLDGYGFCRRIKTHPDLKSIPFILLSTLSDPEDIIRGLDCGADNYVTKPYRTDQLVARMNALLEHSNRLALADPEEPSEPLSVTIGQREYQVRSGRQQTLNLLISTFENAVQKNHELQQSNEDLTLAKESLAKNNYNLQQLNERMKRDLDAAAKVQHSLLPKRRDSPDDRASLAWRYQPCDELAGDFLNCFMLDDDHLALFVVDVSGHGVASSLLSVAVGRALAGDITETSLPARRTRAGIEINQPAMVLDELNRRFPMEDQ